MEMIDTETDVENLTPPKRISWAMRWAYAHPQNEDTSNE